MTAPYVPGPDDQPTRVLPVTPPPRRIKTSNVIALVVFGVVVMCVGGAATLGALLPDPKPSPTSAAEKRGIAATPTRPASSPTIPVATTEPTRQAIAERTATPRPRTSTASPKPTRTTPRPKPTTTKPTGQLGVTPGAFCKPKGAIGYTRSGTLMRCTSKPGEDRARWRKA